MSRHRITITVNGERRQAEVAARRLLVHFQRDDLGITSAGQRPLSAMWGAEPVSGVVSRYLIS